MVASGGGISGVCNYQTRTGNVFGFVSGCNGTAMDGATVTGLDESMPSPEATVAIPSTNVAERDHRQVDVGARREGV